MRTVTTLTGVILMAASAILAAETTSQPSTAPASQPASATASQPTTTSYLKALGMDGGKFPVGSIGYIKEVKVRKVIDATSLYANYSVVFATTSVDSITGEKKTVVDGTTMNRVLQLKGWNTKGLSSGDTFAVNSDAKVTAENIIPPPKDSPSTLHGLEAVVVVPYKAPATKPTTIK